MNSSARFTWRMPGILAAIGWLVFFVAVAPSAHALRPVRVYEVAVKGPESVAQVQDAMRQVLVRATGQRTAASDPALGNLVAEAPRFVQARRPIPGGTQLVFDGVAIEREIANAGRTVWQRERPFTLVVLNPPLTGTAADNARRTLEQVAEQRGLPVSLVPISLTDSNGVELPREAVLMSAQRMGGDAVLIGRGDNVNGQWQWTLQSALTSENFTGSFDAGVNGAVDAMTRIQQETSSVAEAETVVEVEGVSTLADYASVTRLIGEVPGVRRTNLEEAGSSSAVFRVQIRGGSEVLERSLENSGRLVRSGGTASRLIYQYRP
jgi:Uncharacterized protein conserved in bacteria (DUF2066)